MVGISDPKSRREGLCSGDKKSAQAVNPCSRSDAESAQYRNKFRACKGFFTRIFIGKCDCAQTITNVVLSRADDARPTQTEDLRLRLVGRIRRVVGELLRIRSG